MAKIIYFLSFAILMSCTSAQENQTDSSSCEWCGSGEAPENITWYTTIADKDEKGTRIEISGTVFESDGQTPAQDIILYLYHTNAKGIYPKKGDETGNGKRHGYLRSWIKTDSNGQYSFNTIKPEPYPGRTIPAHIHVTIKEPNKEEYWIKDFFFEGDSLLSAKDKKNETDDERFNHVIRLTQAKDLQIGSRDILLKR